MATLKMAFFHLFSLLSLSAATPFIFDDTIKSCINHTKEGKMLEINSETLEVKNQLLEIYFKLCGKFDKSDKKCPAGTIGCVLHTTNGSMYSLGNDIVFEDENVLQSKNGATCPKGGKYSLRVRFQFSNQAPSLTKTEGCTYHIDVMNPAFKTNCGINLYGRFLDLSPLKRSFKAHSDKLNKTFSVTLCQRDESCGGTDVSACELDSTPPMPLASTSSVSPSYMGKNQIIFRGSYNGNNKRNNKKLEVILKCNWEKNKISVNDFTYKDKHIQGKQYSFELETSYGCIKKPIPCIVHDKFLTYDLSDLYSKHRDMWRIDGSPQRNNSIYFLQICGSVELSGTNHSCKSTHAQVCENVNNTDINRGSVLSQLEPTNDGIKATIDHGMKCEKHNGSLYQTVIYLHCDNKDHEPKLFNQTDCDTYFQWKTPSACPKYNSSSCSYLQKDRKKNNNSCIFFVNNKYYNLSAFNDTQEIEDQNSPNLLYKINICDSVFEEEAPCLTDVSITRRNSSEPHIKHKIISLGKFSDSTLKNGSLVLKFETGFFGPECGRDYTSEIRFVCSESEEKPKLVNQTGCHYEFLWITNHGCPRIATAVKKLRTLYNVENCLFINNSTRQSVDLGFIKPVALNSGTQMLLFHVCGRVYSNCSEGKPCTNITFANPKLTFSSNATTLEVDIPRSCSAGHNDFNKVAFYFICDTVREINNNDHIRSKTIVGCRLNIEYLLESVCSLQHPYDSIENPVSKPPRESNVKLPDYLHKEALDKSLQLSAPLRKQNDLEKAVKCSIKSPFTDQALDIRNFTNVFFKNACPNATFNDTFRYVRLLYPTSDVCRPRPSQNISYEVLLVCSSDVKVSPVNEDCLQHYNYERQEYCNFFKPLGSSSTWIIIGSVLICLLGIGLLCLGIRRFLKRRNWNRLPNGFVTVYERVQVYFIHQSKKKTFFS